jgi:enoyl-CoA hydratase/carnithine racemase
MIHTKKRIKSRMAQQNQVNEPILLRSDENGVCTLTLNRPAARNALSMALMQELQSALDTVANDPSVRVVVLAAAGPAFCAGHDMRELRANPTGDFYRRMFETCSALMLTITRLPQPVIAKVHAMASAAGCQLAATADLAIASDGAAFATPGVHIGLFCSTPMVPISRKIGRKAMMEMLLTGDPVDAAEAHRTGLINRVIPADRLDAEVSALAAKIASKSSHTLKVGKEAFYNQLEMGLEDAYAYCGGVMAENMTAADAEEGIDAFLEKRAPVWRDK